MHCVCPHLWIVFSKRSKSVSRHDNDSYMLPYTSVLRPNYSLLASLFVGSEAGLCFLRLAGNNSAGGSSSPSVASSFLRRIQFIHTSTERSEIFKLLHCMCVCCLFAACECVCVCVCAHVWQSKSSKS